MASLMCGLTCIRDLLFGLCLMVCLILHSIRSWHSYLFIFFFLRRINTFRYITRLVNGRICENHEDCWGYDLKRQKFTNLATAHYAFRPFGLLLCKECTKGISTSFPYNHYAASSERVRGSYRTLDLPYFDSLGDRVGPVVVTKDLRQIEKSYKGYEQRKNVLKSMLEELDEEEAAADEDDIIRALIGRYADAESRADTFISSRKDLFWERSLAASKERAGKRIARMKEIMTSLEKLLDGYDHKDIALQHNWDEDAGSIRFEHSPSEDVLSKLFGSTSSASKKKIRAAAEELRRVYNMAAAKYLMPTGFLSSFSNGLDSLKRALFLHCETKGITASTLLCLYYVNVEWIEAATDDTIVDLIMRNIRVSELGREFALVTVDAESSESLCALAECLWDEVWSDYEAWRPKREEVCHAFSQAKMRYVELCGALSEYMASPSVVDFVHDTALPLNNDHSVSRQAVVETIYKDRTGQDMLFDRCFAELLERHTSMYEDPRFQQTLLNLTG